MILPSDAQIAAIVPRVETPRLVLRGFRASDLDAFAANLGDPAATEHMGGVVDRRMAWRMLTSSVGLWLLTGGGWWAVEDRATETFVGTVGAFFRETAPDDLELGWTVVRAHWGRGIATEAARAAAAYAFENQGKASLYAHIDARNVASLRVADHLGMRYEGEADFYGEPTGRYVLERAAFMLPARQTGLA
jgi:RimJ/RimL family protein N-acetyltransferase